MNVIKVSDKTRKYQYELGNGGYCDFNVQRPGIIYIKIRSKENQFDEIIKMLKEVTKIVQAEGMIPQINIKKSNHYLQCVASQCGYKMISARRLSFNIWKHP